MSGDDVHPHEMNETPDLDDAIADALLAGDGSDAEPRLADLLGDMKVAYTSTPPVVGAELAAFIGAVEPVDTPVERRFDRMRASLLAKCGAALAVVVAGTSGLAVAGALPAPVQNAFSTVGIGAPHHHDAGPVETRSEVEGSTISSSIDDSSTSTTVPDEGNTPAAVTHPDNKGGVVSSEAQSDETRGCEQGHAVAAVASDGKSQGNDCKTTGTVPEGTTPTSISDGSGNGNSGGNGNGNGNGSNANTGQGQQDNGKHLGSGKGQQGSSGEHTPSSSAPRARSGADHPSNGGGNG
jgi:hypothetical protein